MKSEEKDKNVRLKTPNNSYKCYDGIPSPISPSYIEKNQSKHNNENKLISMNRSTSLDSLANSSDHENSVESGGDRIEELSDTDSVADGNQVHLGVTEAQVHRKSDLENLDDVEPPNEPVIKAYLEKSHKQCVYKNCGFKKSDDQSKDDSIQLLSSQSIGTVSSVSSINSSVKNRRNSIASSGSVGRMETILEEPIEPKISVKEILARFETLNSLEVCHSFL